MDFKTEKKGYNKSEVDSYIFNLVRNYEQSLAQQKTLIDDLKLKLSDSERKNRMYKDKENLVSKAITSAVAKADEIDKLAQLKYTREMQQLKAFHDKWLSYYDRILKKYPLSDELLSVAKFNEEMNRILDKARAVPPESAIMPQSVSAPHISDLTEAEELTKGEAAEAEVGHAEGEPSSRKRIGYITVDAPADGEDDDDLLLDSDFDPVDRIRSFLTRDKPKKSRTGDDADDGIAAAVAAKKETDDYADRSESGFSFEEALNPKEDLADIMKDLGLLMDD